MVTTRDDPCSRPMAVPRRARRSLPWPTQNRKQLYSDTGSKMKKSDVSALLKAHPVQTPPPRGVAEAPPPSGRKLSPEAQMNKALQKAGSRMTNLLTHAPTYQVNKTLKELRALSRKASTIPALEQQWDEVRETIPISPMSCKYVELILSIPLVELNQSSRYVDASGQLLAVYAGIRDSATSVNRPKVLWSHLLQN